MKASGSSYLISRLTGINLLFSFQHFAYHMGTKGGVWGCERQFCPLNRIHITQFKSVLHHLPLQEHTFCCVCAPKTASVYSL